MLWADEMDVRINPASGDDMAFAGDDFGSRSDDDGHAGLHVRVAGLADAADASGADADVGFDDAPMVEDQGIGDDGVRRALGIADLALAHAVADDFAPAKFDFLAIERMVGFDFNE